MRILLNILFLFFITSLTAIDKNLELETLIQLAISNNKTLKAEQIQVEKYKAAIATAYEMNKTRAYVGYDANNLTENDKALKVIGLEQEFDFPLVYSMKRKLNKSEFERQKSHYIIEENKIRLKVSKLYHQIVFDQQKEQLYIYLDSLFRKISHTDVAKTNIETVDYLQEIMAQAECRKIHTILNQIKMEREITYDKLLAVLQVDSIHIESIKLKQLKKMDYTNKELYNDLYRKNTEVLFRTLKLERMHWFPDINIHAFSGTNRGLGRWVNGFEVGVNVPIFFRGNIAKTKVAKLELRSWEQSVRSEVIIMDNFIAEKEHELEMHQEAINYYKKYGSDLSDEIIKTAKQGFQNGNLDFFQYIQSIKSSIDLEIDYLSNMLEYNFAFLDLYYLNYQDAN